MSWTMFFIGMFLGFALGFLWHKSLVAEHLVGLGERFVGHLLNRLDGGQSVYASFSVGRCDVDDDGDDKDDKGCPLLPDDLEREPWRMN